MKSKKFPLISIIISNYNGVKLGILSECLKSFIKLDYPNYELILVDNASTDNSIKEAKKIFGSNSKFKIIKNSINSYSQGVNLGFNESSGDYIALFNNDVEITKGYLQKLLNAFKKYPKLAVTQGKLLWSYNPSIIDSAGETMDIYGNPVTIGYQAKDDGFFDKEEEILSASGAACLIKKSALEKIGLYDPNFGIGYEDMDHCLRFRQNGFSAMRIPTAIAFHKRGVTDLSQMVRVKVRWNFNKNRLATMIRNYPTFLLIKSIPVTVLIYLGSFFWEAVTYKNINLAYTRIQAIFWCILNLPELFKQRQIIRENTTIENDKRSLKLFAKSDLIGKTKAVILDKFPLKKILYLIPWTYPAEIKNLIPQGSTVLDIGCGDGNVTEWLNYKGDYKIVGVDINKKDLKVAETRRTENKRPIYEELILADLTKEIPFKKKFDVVLCSQVVEHLKKDDALGLIRKMEKLARKRVIVATINGFFQFNHRQPGEHDIHLSGWSPEDFITRGYKVKGSGLRVIYKPGALMDNTPKFLQPVLFFISYISTPLLHFFYPAALLLISHRDINEKV